MEMTIEKKAYIDYLITTQLEKDKVSIGVDLINQEYKMNAVNDASNYVPKDETVDV